MEPVASSCYFGKLPFHGDFLRSQPSPPEIQELDTWFSEGIYRCRELNGQSWDTQFDGIGLHRFLYFSPNTRALLAGIFLPSRDRVGRRYPFVVATRNSGLSSIEEYAVLPVLLADFFAAAADLVDDDWDGVDLATFQQRADSMEWQADSADARRGLGAFLWARSTDDFWIDSVGVSDPVRQAVVLRDIKEALQPPYPPRYALRLPSAGLPGEISFWLSLFGAWSPRGNVPTFVSWNGSESSPGVLSVVLDALSARYFEAVFSTRANDHGFELVYEGPVSSDRRQGAEAVFGRTLRAWPNLEGLLGGLARG